MMLSKNANRTARQLPKDTHFSLKRPLFYVVTSSLLLIAGMQTANAEVCAPDFKYLLPKLTDSLIRDEAQNYKLESLIEANKDSSGGLSGVYGFYLRTSKEKLEGGFYDEQKPSHGYPTKNQLEDYITFEEAVIKQYDCVIGGGKLASSSSDFDTSGSFTGRSQQGSNKKSKSNKGNNQEQVATANSNENSTNRADSDNAEPSDAKSKGKEFAKDDPRLHASSCVSVVRKKNQLYGVRFKNICPYPIEVIWCSNSKEDPNQCDRGWYSRSNFGIGHSEPIDSIRTATHWVFSACKGEDSIFSTDEMRQKRQHRCVSWKN